MRGNRERGVATMLLSTALEAAYLIGRLGQAPRSGGNIAGTQSCAAGRCHARVRAPTVSRARRRARRFLTFGSKSSRTISQTLIVLEQKGASVVTVDPSPRPLGRIGVTRRGEAVLRGDPLRRLADDITAATGGEPGELLATLQAHVVGNDREGHGRAFGILPHMQAFPPQCQTGQRLAASLQLAR